MSSVEARLSDMGLTVPDVVAPVAAYVPTVQTGSLIFTAGQLPMQDGSLIATGKVGGTVSPEQAGQCARIAALNAVAAVKEAVTDLDRVTRVVKAGGRVARAAAVPV